MTTEREQDEQTTIEPTKAPTIDPPTLPESAPADDESAPAEDADEKADLTAGVPGR